MRRSGSIVLAALLLVGCSAVRDPAPVVIPAPERGATRIADPVVPTLDALPTEPPPGRSAVAAAIVWVDDERLTLRTRSLWIEAASGRAGAPVWLAATRDEPVVVAGDALVAIRTEGIATATGDCDECPGCPGLEGDLERAVVVDLVSGERAPITSADSDNDSVGVDARFELSGLVGAVVFIDEHVSLATCGAAHPLFSDRALAYDVERGAPIAIGPSPAQLADAVASSREELREMRESCGETDAFSPELYATRIAFEPGLTTRTIYRMTAPVPYMCGTGPGHYSVEAEVDRSELPATHPPVAIPPWLAAVLRTSRVRGISAAVPANRIEALRRAFRQAP